MKSKLLAETVASMVKMMISLEQKSAKVFIKLSKSANAPELAKAFDPEQTDIPNHIKRLKLLTKLLPKNAPLIGSPLQITSVKLSKNKSAQQDVQLIFIASQLLAMKNNQYEFIINLLNQFGSEEATVLVRQSSADNENTKIWINRTLIQLIS